MKKTIIILVVLLFFVTTVKAACVTPTDDLDVSNDTTLCSGTYYLNDTGDDGIIKMSGNHYTLDCNNTMLVGNNTGTPISFISNVTIENCRAANYSYGYALSGVSNVILNNSYIENSSSGGNGALSFTNSGSVYNYNITAQNITLVDCTFSTWSYLFNSTVRNSTYNCTTGSVSFDQSQENLVLGNTFRNNNIAPLNTHYIEFKDNQFINSNLDMQNFSNATGNTITADNGGTYRIYAENSARIINNTLINAQIETVSGNMYTYNNNITNGSVGGGLNYNSINYDTIRSTGTAIGFETINTTGNNVTGVNIITSSTAIKMYSNTSRIVNTTINSSTTDIDSQSGNHTIINTIVSTTNLQNDATLNYFWYLRTFANDTSGNLLNNITISAYNVNNTLENSSEVVDGYTPWIIVPDYSQNATTIFNVRNNYTINATENGIGSQTLNLSSNTTVNFTLDVIPAIITSLQNQSQGATQIFWNWTNPTNGDFNHTEVWINNVFIANVSAPNNSYNATNLTSNTNYTIQTRTVDHYENINTTWVNSSTKTTIVVGTNIILMNISNRLSKQGDTVLVGLNAENFDLIWANITLPNGTTTRFNLTVNISTNYSPPVQGRFNISFYSRDSYNTTNTSSFFYVAPPMNFSLFFINQSTSQENATVEMYALNTTILSNTTIGNYTNISIPDYNYTLNLSFFNNSFKLSFKNFSTNSSDSKTIGVDKTIAGSSYLRVYAVNSSLNFSESAVDINYSLDSVTSEDDIVIEKCSNWNFLNRECIDSWTSITNNKNTTTNLFSFNTTSFSAFGIRQPSTSASSSTSTNAAGSGILPETEEESNEEEIPKQESTEEPPPEQEETNEHFVEQKRGYKNILYFFLTILTISSIILIFKFKKKK